ncbi:ATP-binding protein [Paraferrimonas sedimenticola]|nr:transporter substrate-binding domain-containing protein [Paraferrimonas sedimenticola]
MRIVVVLIGLLLSVAATAQDSVTFGVHSKTAPMEWRENGVEQGFHVDLMRKVTAMSGTELNIRRKSFSALVEQMELPPTDVDLICVVTPIDFSRPLQQSDPIYATHAKAFTRQTNAFINSWNDLAGKRVAIKKGSFVDVYVSNIDAPFERVDVDLYETGFRMLGWGRVDVVLAENLVARRLLPKYPLVRSASDPLIFGTFNFVAHPSQKALMEQVNKAIRELKITGEYDTLVNKWFGIGREKVDLIANQQRWLRIAIVVAVLSVVGLVITWNMSVHLRRRSLSLSSELKQREAAERALTSVSQQFQSVLDGIPHGVFLFGADATQLWSNGKYLEQLLCGKLTKNNGEPFVLKDLLSNVSQQGQDSEFELTKDNQHWRCQAHPISSGQVVVLLQLITEQKRLQQAHEQASRLASLGELSAGVAHEINNPTGLILHNISLLAEVICDIEPLVEQQQAQDPYWQLAGLPPQEAMQEAVQASGAIEEGARRISRIVSDLKQYAAPAPREALATVDLNQVVDASLRLTTNQTKRHQLVLDLSPEPALLIGDASQLQQVLINLIQNACHAMADDNGELSIATWREGYSIHLRVSDSGRGMEPATLRRIREPFFTTRRNQGGTGLGLSVSSRIVQEHKGSWDIQSKLGQGSQFELTFPYSP